ncbi:MAG: hypothetical protein HY833_03600 [Candidatus Aenigmarchaeota archaeon]|nr:hypothetical protein [Candidatus Aenigmarchaeota archaeon]
MKLSPAKMLIWVMAVVVLAVVFIQPGSETGKYVYQVETIDNKCTFDEYQQQDIRAVGDSILIVMPIQTPTPCYEVQGSVDFFRSDITVNLQTKKRAEACTAECVGVTVARVVISNLDSGTYGLQINAPDKSVRTSVKVK